MAAIGLAFVDIVGDTSRTGAQIERDLNREIDFVEETIDPVQIDMALAAGTAAHLRDVVEADLASVGDAVQAINVNASLDPDTRARISHQLQVVAQSLRGAREQIRIGIDEDQIVEETVAAVETAVHVAEVVAPPIEIETTIDNDSLERVARDFSGIGNAAKGALGPLSGLGSALLGLGGAAQGAFAVVSTLKLIAPAAALAAPAIVTVGAAMATVKLASAGVGDAVSAALDPSDPEKFNEALKKLSPEAKKFALAVHELQPAFKDLQQSVQNAVFKDLGKVLTSTATAVLPTLKLGLTQVGEVLGDMGASAANAAKELAQNGTLGTALGGASQALGRFSDLPGVAVKAFGQLAVAATPAFDKLAASAAKSLGGVGDKINSAFQSGALRTAIEAAVDQLKSLFNVVKNLGTVFGNITSNAQGFNGVLGILEKVSAALADVTGTDEAQAAFKALFGTLNNLVATALPLVSSLFADLAPVISALAPGVNTVVNALGAGLRPIIDALGPLLTALAGSISDILVAFSPLLPVLGQLIGKLGPILTPIVVAIGQAFVQLTPLVTELANILLSVLGPVLDQLPKLIQPFLDLAVRLISTVLPVLVDLFKALEPAINQIVGAFVNVATALAPVLTQLFDLAIKALQPLLPLIPPIISTIGQLASILAGELATQINQIVVPALRFISQILSGDFRGAFQSAQDVVFGFADTIRRIFTELPGKILLAIGNLSLTMIHIGEDIINSLIDGIKSGIGKLGNVLSDITNYIAEHKGPIEKDRVLLTPAGQAIMQGLITGIQSQRGALGNELESVTGMFAGVGANSRIGIGSQFAANASQPSMQAPHINAQIFVGDREITDIVDARVVLAGNRTGRQLSFGTRR